MRSVLRHPARAALAGALALAFSAILYRTSDASPETGAFFRCVYALPVLWMLVRLEELTLGPRPRRLRLTAWVAGAFFAADLLLWHHAIEAVGAGLATVLGNTQIVLVGLIAWALFRERPAPSALAAIPIAMVGIVLISGALEEGAYGDNPPLGVLLGLLTGFAYSGFLLTLRHGAGDDRRVAGPLLDATLATAVLVLQRAQMQARPTQARRPSLDDLRDVRRRPCALHRSMRARLRGRRREEPREPLPTKRSRLGEGQEPELLAA